jgi:FixJ family two-component response regulator
LSGLEALKKFAAEEGVPTYAAVVLVGSGNVQISVEAVKNGAHDCLEKDRARGAELRRAMTQAIENADQRRRVAARERELIEQKRALARHYGAFRISHPAQVLCPVSEHYR